ncbi:MAG: hypothetical protein V4488_16065 [Pseudomonadota bacterium]
MEKVLKASTDEIFISNFRSHGRVDIRIENHILYSDAYGPFNAELIHALVRTQQTLIAKAGLSGPLGEVIRISNSALAGRDVVDIFKQAMQQMQQGGRSRVGAAYLVAEDVEGASIMLPAILAAYAKIGMPCRAFDSMQDAENWVTGLLEAERKAELPGSGTSNG